MYKLQNINPISPIPKFTLGIIQIIVKSISTSFQCLVQYKIKLSVQFQYLTFQPDSEVRDVYEIKVFASIWVYTSFLLIGYAI